MLQVTSTVRGSMKVSRSFPAEAAAVRQTRAFVHDALAGVDSDVSADAVLMASEMATNCIRHAQSRYIVTVNVTAREIRVDVADAGSGVPTRRAPTSAEPTGRGLAIVDNLADDWGTSTKRGRTTVWFALRRQRRTAAR